MSTVRLSPKFEIVIPKELRRSMGIKPGKRFRIMRYGDVIELVPIEPMRKMRGFVKGMDTNINRDDDKDEERE